MASFEPKPFGKYFLVEKLAVGGMAEIYKAKTFGVDGFEKLLAIKKILSHYSADKEFISMLTDEAKLVVRLSHTNIVQIYDLGRVGDDYFISMEYIDGVNLREVLSKAKQLKEGISLPICLFIISEVCKGLDYAHSKRDDTGNPLHIVHRDISPQNILISFEGETKIVDFGIAKAAMNVSHTSAGILKGKINYMSPEQALGKPIDGKTDLFSAGLLLYELVAGQRFFVGDTHFEVLKKIRSTQITEETLSDTIPSEVRPILAKALAYHTKDRFDTAGDFQIALTKLLYSSYSDFSPKHLSAIIRKWFVSELKERRKQNEDERPIDNEALSLLEGVKDEISMVHSRKELKEGLLQDTTKPEDSMAPDKLRHGPSVRYEDTITNPRIRLGHPVMKALGAIAMALLLGFAGFALYRTSKKSPEEVTREEAPVPSEETSMKAPLPVESQPEGDQNATTVEAKPSPLPESKTLDVKLTKEVPTGFIEVESSPSGARIFLDGRETATKTPGRLSNLAVGKQYQISLRMDRYTLVTREVDLLSEKGITLSVPLELEGKYQKATIKLTSDVPGTEFSLNGKGMGVLPKTFEVNPGLVKIRAVKKGYQPAERQVTLKGGEERKLALSLIPERPKPIEAPKPVPIQSAMTSHRFGQVRLDSSPRGAGVMINGEKAGITPVVIPQIKKDSSYTITLTLPGYKQWTKTFKMSQNSVEFMAQMTRE